MRPSCLSQFYPQPQFIALRDASGPRAHIVKGAYLLQEGLCNSLPQYQKEDDADWWLVMDKNGKSAVKTTNCKVQNSGGCEGVSVEKGLVLPIMAKNWKVHDGRKQLLQPDVVVFAMVCPTPPSLNSFYFSSTMYSRPQQPVHLRKNPRVFSRAHSNG